MIRCTGTKDACIGFALAMAMAVSMPALGASYLVTTSIDESTTNGELSLREALELSNANVGPDTITFDSGLQGATITLIDGMLIAAGETMIDGSNQVIDANGNSRVLYIAQSGRVTLSNLTFTNGNAGSATDGTSNGGAVLADSTFVLILNQVDITNSHAYAGGGMSISDFGTVVINGGEFSGNSAIHAGGAIHSSDRSPLLILNDVSGTNNSAGPSPGDGGFHYAALGSETQVNGGSFVGNLAGRDGGVFWNDEGELKLTGPVTIDGNTANGAAASNGGGAIFQSPFGTLTIEAGAQISNNVAGGLEGRGGGILSFHDLNISNSRIVGNQANGAGGGIALGALTDSTLYQVTVSDNHAGLVGATSNPGNGGGVHIDGYSVVTIENSTLSGNIAENAGGGIWMDQGPMNVYSTTISGNSSALGGGVYFSGTDGAVAFVSSTIARNMGGGIRLDGGYASSRNTIVSDNFGAACSGAGQFISAGYSLLDDVTGCNFVSGGVSDIIGVGAILAELAYNGGATETHLPELDSPVLDTGHCVGETADQRGMARPVDLAAFPNATTGCDIGSVERQFTTDAIFSGDFEVQ